MFSQIFDAIEEWMRELLTGMITSNLDTMFTDVNQKTGEIATQVGQTPQGWNGSIFSMIRNLSDSVIMPIAGIIITLVLCYELISMLTERNNMHDIDTWMFFKYFVKMWIAVYLVSNTFTITMAVFDVGQHVVNSAAGVITGSTGSFHNTGKYGNRRTCCIGAGNPYRRLLYEDFVCTDHSDHVWTYDRDLPIYLSCADSIRNYEQQRMGTDRHKLFQRTLCPGFPGISDDGMRCNLCSACCRYPVFR